jgi:hypothetical protein
MAQYARPDADVSAGNWGPSTGSDLYAVIDEAVTDDSDYISVTDSDGSAETCQVELGGVTDPVSDSGHIITVRASEDSSSSVVALVITLKQGATTIATYTESSITGSATNYPHTLTTGEADSITNYSALSLVFAATDGMGMGTTTTIYQAFFECGNAPAPTGIAGVTYMPTRSVASNPTYNPTQRIR